MEEQTHCSLPRLRVSCLPAMKPQRFPSGLIRNFRVTYQVRLTAWMPVLYHISVISVSSPWNKGLQEPEQHTELHTDAAGTGRFPWVRCGRGAGCPGGAGGILRCHCYICQDRAAPSSSSADCQLCNCITWAGAISA